MGQLRSDFPNAVFYNRFVEFMPRIFYELMLFMCLYSFGRCSSITFVDSTMIPVCHNLRRYSTRCLPVLQKVGKVRWDGATAFKLHLFMQRLWRNHNLLSDSG